MKKFKERAITVILMLLLSLVPVGVAACTNTPPPDVDGIAVTGVTLEAADNATSLKKGQTLQLTATVAPENATNKNVTYSSSAKGVATVNESGLVTAVGGGEVTITVTTVDGGKTDTVALTVTVDAESVTVTAAGSDGTMFTGSTLNLTAAVLPADTTVKTVEWKVTSNGTEVANVLTADGSGATFTPTAAGSYVVTATAKDGSGVSGAYSVTVSDAPVTGADHFFEGEDAVRTNGDLGEIIVHRNDNDTVNARNNTSLGNINSNIGATLTYKVDAAEACMAGLYLNLAFGGADVENIFALKVNGEDVAVVGKFHQDGADWVTYSEFWFANVDLNKGVNTIVLTVTGGCGNYDYMTLKCDTDITTPKIVTSITVTPASNETVFVNDSLVFTANVLPDTAVDRSVEWKVTSNGTEVANVLTADGSSATFTPTAAGSYVVTATAKDGSGVSGSYSVTVYDAPVTGADHKFKGKDAVLTGGINISGDTLGNINENIGATVTYKVDAKAACTAGLYLNLAFPWATASNCFDIDVNGNRIEVVKSFKTQGTPDWGNYAEYWFANVELNQGVNTIVLTVTGGCGNYDYMNLRCDNVEITAPDIVTDIKVVVRKELLKPEETTKLDVTVTGVADPVGKIEYSSSDTAVATVCADGTITAVANGKTTITIHSTDGSNITRTVNIFVKSGDGTAYEAEKAALTNANVEASNGNYVGGLNNEGAKVTFTVNSASGGKALLRIYTAVVHADKLTIDRYYTVKINGVDADLSGGQFAWNGVAPNWNTDNGYFTVEIDLAAGDNTIELISVGTNVATNLDKIVIYE